MAEGASITCVMCGSVFDPEQASGCASCPLGAHCSLACCPACGFSSVDVRRSRLVRFVTRLASVGTRRQAHAAGSGLTLAGARTGQEVRIDGLDDLPAWQGHQLAAYGIAPGRRIDVVQTSPVVIVRVDHMEVAFELRLAEGIRVTRPDDAGGSGVEIREEERM